MFASRTAWQLAPNRLSRALERLKAGGKGIVDLTASNPTILGFQYDRATIASSLTQPAILQYSPQPRGLQCAREAVVAYYRERGEQTPSPEQIVLTSSTSEAYSFVFRLLCDPGDELLVPVPSYPLFEFITTLNDVRSVPYHLFYDHGWHVDLHDLEGRITKRTRAIVVVHPNNPTGSYISDVAGQQLNELCSRYRLALISDEVFLDYQLDDAKKQSFVCNGEALTFTLSGISKICALPQMKLAWIVVGGPGEMVTDALSRLEIIADTYLSVSTPVQLALPTLLATRMNIQRQLFERIHANVAELDALIAARGAFTRLHLEGGWSAVLRVPVTQCDEELALTLLEKHSVLVYPGHFFDFPPEGYLVVSLIVPPEIFASGVRKLAAVIAS
jgi:aspartate/methionine/tyrosine aminotransferase